MPVSLYFFEVFSIKRPKSSIFLIFILNLKIKAIKTKRNSIEFCNIVYDMGFILYGLGDILYRIKKVWMF